MSTAKIQAVFWLAVLLCALLIVTAATGALDRNASLVVLLGGVLGLPIAFVVRSRLAVRAREAQARRDAVRVPELECHVQSGLPMEIAGSSGIGLLLVLLVIAILCTLWAMGKPEWGVIAMAVFFWTLVLACAFAVAPLLGKPILRIAHDGVESPAYGKLPWSEIDGIDLSEIRIKGQTVGHVLHLLVPQLAERQQAMHPTARLLWKLLQRGRPEVRVRLAATSESPHVIFRLCQSLHMRRTGRKLLWNSSMSARMLAELRHGEQQLAELERAGGLAESDPAAAMAILDKLDKERRPPSNPKVARELAEAEAEMKALVAEHGQSGALRLQGQRMEERRRKFEESLWAARRTHWLTWVVAAIAALYLILQIAWLVSG